MWIISRLNKPPHDFHSWVTFDVTSKTVFKFRWSTFWKIWFQFPFKFNLDESLVNGGFLVPSCQAMLSSLWLILIQFNLGWTFFNQTVLQVFVFLLLFFSGFPSQKGRHRLSHNPIWAEAVCEQVPLEPYVFYPDKPVHIQVSVNHVNFSDPAYVHEAVVAWVEDIMENNFTVCVTQAGRNEKRNGETFATVDWMAYQGAPDGGVSGEMDMPTWWTGTNCRTVSLPSVSSICSILKSICSVF